MRNITYLKNNKSELQGYDIKDRRRKLDDLKNISVFFQDISLLYIYILYF